jgi:hypothetical protein
MTRGMRAEDATLTLATAAAAWRRSRDHADTPGGADDTARHASHELPFQALEMQRAWLDEASEVQLATYVADLVRVQAERRNGFEHVSSEPMTEVVVTALMARRPPPKTGPVVLYDPVCGTAGMLTAAASALGANGASVKTYGQDVNQWAAAVASAALTVGAYAGSITAANCLTGDAYPAMRYDYAVAEPPFGLEWRHSSDSVREQHRAGKFPGGLPRLTDASLLFVQHLVEKMRALADGGGRAVVLVAPNALRDSGGDAIRRWLLAEDLLEAVIGLPEGIASNTALRLNALVLTNHRPVQRQGKIQVVDLRGAYEDRTGGRLSRRRLRPDALEALRQALSTVKPGPISRTVDADRFIRRTATVRSGTAAGHAREWRLPLSRADDADAFVARHVQAPPSRVVDAGVTSECVIDVDEVLNRDAGEVRAWVSERHWPVSRLAALTDDPSYVPSASHADHAEVLAALAPGLRLMLPVESAGAVVYGDPGTAAPVSRFVALASGEDIQAEFLAGYLNSNTGVLARRAALQALGGGAVSPRTVSKSAVDALLAALVVPVPDSGTQQRLIEADSAVRAASARAARTAVDLWRTPERHAELVRQLAPARQDRPLAAWAQELPYPIATALWACEAQRGNEHAAQAQLFHFWEAVAAFVATVLLSALDQDNSLRRSEMESLRATLSKQHLSMERASLGAWLVLTQRLGRRFRDMADSPDADERARVTALFAGAPDELVRALCSPDLSTLLTSVVRRRNDWSGHTGAKTNRLLADQNAWLLEQIEALRSIVDGTWAGAPLVRAGTSSYEEGVFVHEVERVMGLNTPFLRETVSVGSPMNRGQLYVVADGAQRGLRIEPFVQLRDSPTAAHFTCYFYNRLDKGEARLVSYHLGGDEELLEASPALATLVAGFDETAVSTSSD